MDEELERLEELEAAEGQIEWFEKTRVDKDKKPRYANLNLKEIKEGDYCVNIQRGYIKLINNKPEYKYYNRRNDVFKKVIAHLSLNNAPTLEGVALLSPWSRNWWS